MAKVTKTGELTIVVSRYWPLSLLKTVEVKVDSESSWHNDVTLNKEQAETLYKALGDVLGYTKEDKNAKNME